jgi:hypothetical protein
MEPTARLAHRVRKVLPEQRALLVLMEPTAQQVPLEQRVLPVLMARQVPPGQRALLVRTEPTVLMAQQVLPERRAHKA